MNNNILYAGDILVTKINSINQQYANAGKRGRILTRKSFSQKKEMIFYLNKSFSKSRHALKGLKGEYKLELIFYFGKRFISRDATNCLKLVEDVLTEYFGYDDSQNYIVNVEKKPLQKEDIKEKISFVISKLGGE